MTVQKIKEYLSAHFESNDYRLFNTFIFDFESDFFCMSKSGYAIECEIKVSRSDFFADFKKTHWNKKTKHEILADKTQAFKPNRFYFAVPKDLIKKEEVPEYAGLIYIDSYSTIIKQAPFLHKEKLMDNDIHFVRQLMRKFYFRNMDLRREMQLREVDLRYGQGRFDKRY